MKQILLNWRRHSTILLGIVTSVLILKNATAQDSQEETPPPADPSNVQAVLREPMAGAGENNLLITLGNAQWKLEQETPDSAPVVHGIIEFPTIQFSIDLTLRKNDLADIAASHIFSLKFIDKGKEQIRLVRDFGGIELREKDGITGSYLKGLSVPLEKENYAIALFKTEYDIRTNTELLLEYDWFSFPVMFNNGRTAFISFAKGNDGEAIFKEAFQAWNSK